MKVVVATADRESTRRWQGVMQKALPDFEVLAWEPGLPATGARYAVVWSPPDAVFQVETELQAVFNLGAGVDKILGSPSLPDIPVYRLEDAGMASQMAEYVIYSLLTFSRGFAYYEHQQRQRNWTPLPDPRREDWPVGIMGLGTLGTHVASAVASLGYPVAGWARSPRSDSVFEAFYGPEGFTPFLRRTRVLVNLLPLTPQTEGIINKQLLERLLPEAVLINVARGAHVVDDDLLAALDSGRLQGAFLDVFHDEPLPAEHPYWSHPRVRVTPHIAAATLEAEAAEQISERIYRLERGEEASGLVSREMGY